MSMSRNDRIKMAASLRWMNDQYHRRPLGNEIISGDALLEQMVQSGVVSMVEMLDVMSIMNKLDMGILFDN